VIEIGDDSRIRGILLFGTPHFDAGLAQWAILSGQEKGIKECEKTAELQNWSKYTKNIEDLTEEKGLWAILWKFMGYSKDQKEKKVKIDENKKDLDAIADMQKEFCRKYTGCKQCIRLACCFSEGCHPENDLVSSFSSDIISCLGLHVLTSLKMISPEWCILPGVRPILIRSSHHFNMTNSKPSEALPDSSFSTVQKVITRWTEELKGDNYGNQKPLKEDEPQNATDPSKRNDPAYGRASYLNNLGNELWNRYEQIGHTADLEEAIQATRQAIDFTPEDHPDRAVYWSKLGSILEKRYERIGHTADLEEAIQATRQAIDFTPEDHSDRAVYWSKLGSILEKRYERIGHTADLEEAIQATRQAIDFTLEDHPDRAVYWSKLGSILEKRYERIGDTADLEEAIQAAQQAVNSTPENHPNRGSYLNNFGNELWNRYKRTDYIADLEAAIQAARQAVNSTPENHPDQAGYLNNLGERLSHRYKRTGDTADLEEAIQAAQQAVNSTPENHPNRADRLYNLGAMLVSRYERTDDIDYFKIGNLFSSALKCDNSDPFRRIQAAARAVKLLGLLQNLEQAAELARDAINLLPTVSNRSLHRSDQQYAVSHFSELAALGCSILLQLDQPEQALEILEKGRTTILSQLVSDRSGISTLRKAHPKLARQFESLLDGINAPLPTQDALHLTQIQQRRRDGVAAFNSCVRKIREIPGYERFLLGPTPTEMQACATEGWIVVVNITDLGSDAIIVSSSSKIKRLELPNLSPREARSRLAIESDNKDFCKYLTWLWQFCVREVAITCELKVQHSKKDLPRIWWIGTGLASSMPFHAAGDHSPESDENLFMRAVSSYTPSIKALAYSRERSRKNEICGENVLLATMTTTPSLSPLPGVEVEKTTILKILPAQFKPEVHDHPSTHSIIQSLEHCSIAHFACHGFTDSTDPSKSGLVFQKHIAGRLVPDVMTVHKVSELKLERARIAYLSASSTAENGAARLRDEVIHVVSGFQVAGFAHVIGCLWASSDIVSVEVAKGFYKTLFQRAKIEDKDVEIEDEDVAMALHEGVRAARERDRDKPLEWAQFVHYGA
jgi:tetratricopeptide (TPR) repeat protein